MRWLYSSVWPVLIFVPQARVYYVRKQYREALRLFQRALTLKPNAKPDPRVGIGLCLWAMGSKDKAKMAWQRSAEVVSTALNHRVTSLEA